MRKEGKVMAREKTSKETDEAKQNGKANEHGEEEEEDNNWKEEEKENTEITMMRLREWEE